jgi:hypothetical protein
VAKEIFSIDESNEIRVFCVKIRIISSGYGAIFDRTDYDHLCQSYDTIDRNLKVFHSSEYVPPSDKINDDVYLVEHETGPELFVKCARYGRLLGGLYAAREISEVTRDIIRNTAEILDEADRIYAKMKPSIDLARNKAAKCSGKVQIEFRNLKEAIVKDIMTRGNDLTEEVRDYVSMYMQSNEW